MGSDAFLMRVNLNELGHLDSSLISDLNENSGKYKMLKVLSSKPVTQEAHKQGI